MFAGAADGLEARRYRDSRNKCKYFKEGKWKRPSRGISTTPQTEASREEQWDGSDQPLELEDGEG